MRHLNLDPFFKSLPRNHLIISCAPLNCGPVQLEVKSSHAADQAELEGPICASPPVNEVIFRWNICASEVQRLALRCGKIDFAQVLQQL